MTVWTHNYYYIHYSEVETRAQRSLMSYLLSSSCYLFQVLGDALKWRSYIVHYLYPLCIGQCLRDTQIQYIYLTTHTRNHTHVCLCICVIRSHVDQANFELCPGLTLNSWFSCLYLISPENTGICHHAPLSKYMTILSEWRKEWMRHKNKGQGT